MRSAISSATLIWCVLRKTLMPRRLRSFSTSFTTRAWCGSRPTIGSSMTKTSGSWSSALAMATRWRVPWLSPSIGLLSQGSRLNRGTSSSAARAMAPSAMRKSCPVKRRNSHGVSLS